MKTDMRRARKFTVGAILSYMLVERMISEILTFRETSVIQMTCMHGEIPNAKIFPKYYICNMMEA